MGFNFPNAPTDGTIFTPPGGPAYTFTGGVWIGSGAAGGGSASITVSDTPPADPKAGALWYESDTGNTFIFYDDLSSQQWVQINTGGVQQAIATDAPADGKLYSRRNNNWIAGTAETRNRVVNGSMLVSAENGGAVVVANGTFPADQWMLGISGITINGAQQYAQVTPEGGSYTINTSLQVVKASLAAGDLWQICQTIEGLHLSDLQWGTASAKQVVLRFSFYTVNAGAFGVNIRNGPANRSWNGLFTAPVGWSKQVIVVPGDTTGTWPKDNTLGMYLGISFAAGSAYIAPSTGWATGNFVAPPGMTNAAATAGAAFYLSDVGLHADPNGTGTPPPWQAVDIGDEIRRCQRYFAAVYGVGRGNGSYNPYSASAVAFPVAMRTTPATTTAPGGTRSNVNSAGCTAYSPTGGRLDVNAQAAGDYYVLDDVIKLNARM